MSDLAVTLAWTLGGTLFLLFVTWVVARRGLRKLNRYQEHDVMPSPFLFLFGELWRIATHPKIAPWVLVAVGVVLLTLLTQLGGAVLLAPCTLARPVARPRRRGPASPALFLALSPRATARLAPPLARLGGPQHLPPRRFDPRAHLPRRLLY